MNSVRKTFCFTVIYHQSHWINSRYRIRYPPLKRSAPSEASEFVRPTHFNYSDAWGDIITVCDNRFVMAPKR